METKPVGKSNLQIPPLGLGTSTFGREIDEATSRDILDYAFEQGIRLIDTAEGYGGGNAKQYREKVLGIQDSREVSDEMYSSEKIIGRWLRDRGCRNEVVLLTKVSSGGSPENIETALNRSLENLGVDCVDIYMMHSPDAKVPLKESLQALTNGVDAGKVKTIGCSNFGIDLLEEALRLHQEEGLARMESTEPPLNLAIAPEQHALFPYCRKKAITTIAYSPLAAGFLTGKYSPSLDSIPKGTRFDVIPGHVDVYFSDRNFKIVEQLRALSESTGKSMIYLAMAWATGHPLVSCTLVGARKRSHLDNALAAMQEPLPAELRETMDSWLDTGGSLS